MGGTGNREILMKKVEGTHDESLQNGTNIAWVEGRKSWILLCSNRHSRHVSIVRCITVIRVWLWGVCITGEIICCMECLTSVAELGLGSADP